MLDQIIRIQRKATLSSVLYAVKVAGIMTKMEKRLWCGAAILSISAAFIVFWQEIRSIIMVFGVAVVFSLLISPICIYMERKMMPECAAACSIGLFCIVALVVLCAFVPYLIGQLQELIHYMMPIAHRILADTHNLPVSQALRDLPWNNVGGIAVEAVGKLTASMAKSGAAIAAQTGRIVFALVLSYYFLYERKRICAHLLLCIPTARRVSVIYALRGCGNAVFGYISGVLKTCVFIGGSMYIGLLILGIPQALLLSLIMGVFELLPYVGPVFASVPVFLSALSLGGQKSLMVLILILIVQFLEGNFVSPYFTAASTSLHPALALISVYVGGSFFGLWGILLAIPVIVAVRSIIWSAKQTCLSL